MIMLWVISLCVHIFSLTIQTDEKCLETSGLMLLVRQFVRSDS